LFAVKIKHNRKMKPQIGHRW